MSDEFWKMWPQLQGTALWVVFAVVVGIGLLIASRYFFMSGDRRTAVAEKRNADAIAVLNGSVSDLKTQGERQAQEIEELRIELQKERELRAAQDKRMAVIEQAYSELLRRLPEIAQIIELRLAKLNQRDDVILYLCEELKRIKPLSAIFGEANIQG